jgi:hypothetical protein
MANQCDASECSELTPEARLTQVAATLSVAVQRLKRSREPVVSGQVSESLERCLEVPAKRRLTVVAQPGGGQSKSGSVAARNSKKNSQGDV